MKQRIAIFSAAYEALEAAFDAFGHAANVADAWSFITTMWFESEDPRFADLPATMPRSFKQDYSRLILEAAAGNRFAPKVA